MSEVLPVKFYVPESRRALKGDARLVGEMALVQLYDLASTVGRGPLESFPGDLTI